MKFKLLKEKFDYNSTAISDAGKVKEQLQYFLDDLDITPHYEEYLSEEDIQTLKKTVEILDKFYTGYSKASYKAALDYFK